MKPGPCYVCGRDPAAGYASLTVGNEERWFCHGDDDDEATCYMLASWGAAPGSLTWTFPMGGDDE